MENEILAEYDKKKASYVSLCSKAKLLITELLEVNGIVVHHLTNRVKERSKVEEKLVRKSFKYTSLNEVTDIAGIRIITYFSEDVDTVADIISSEFKVDPVNTIDKRNIEEDRFGYMSMHYVVSISNTRAKLAEYKPLKNLKFEIQIRSLLQHGWAEIEHDLGYKGAKGIPSEFKRDFNRISALLETADKEFDRLKRELTSYNKEVEKDFASKDANFNINNSTLNLWLQQDKNLHKINMAIAKYYGVNLTTDMEEVEIGELSEKLKHLGVTAINGLSSIFAESRQGLISALPEMLKHDVDEVRGVDRSVGVHIMIDYLGDST